MTVASIEERREGAAVGKVDTVLSRGLLLVDAQNAARESERDATVDRAGSVAWVAHRSTQRITQMDSMTKLAACERQEASEGYL